MSKNPTTPAAAILIGANGQDGTLLSRHLLDLNIPVISVGRGECDLLNRMEIENLFQAGLVRHDVYFLAAIHKSSESLEHADPAIDFKNSLDLHANAPALILEVIRQRGCGDRFFYASSSRVFGNPRESPQTEATPRCPLCIYGITKLAGMNVCDYYRQSHGVFASTGILYNHESPLRKLPFLSKKVSQAAVASHRNKGFRIRLQNINTHVDWSYAGDIVRAMTLALTYSEPKDFIMSSGKTHSVKDFVIFAFDELGLDWTEHVEFVSDAGCPIDKRLVGDNSLLKTLTGWNPSIDFQEMVKMLVQAELRL